MNFYRLLTILVLLVVILPACNKDNEVDGKMESLQTQLLSLSEENEKLKDELKLLEEMQLHFSEVHNIPMNLNERMKEYLNYEEGITSYFFEDGKTYVLLKAPNYVEGTAVQLDGITYTKDKVSIYYQFTLKENEQKNIILYELNGEYKVEFFEANHPTHESLSSNKDPDDFNFIFSFGVMNRNILNTFEETYTKDLVNAGTTITELTLTNEEKRRIFEFMADIELFQYPEEVEGMNIKPESGYVLEIKVNGRSKNIRWIGEFNNNERDRDFEALTKMIIEIIESKEAYKKLPPAEGYYE